MSRKLSSVLIIGASGTIGQPITRAIAGSRSSFDRVAIFTSQSTVENKAPFVDELKKQDVEIIVGDIGDKAQVKSAFEGERSGPSQSG